MLDRIANTINGISVWTGKTASWLVVGVMLLVCIEVIRRYIFGKAIIWMYEVSSGIFGAIMMLGIAYAWACDDHVKIDFLTMRLSKRKAILLDMVLTAVFVFPCWIIILYYGFDFARDSWAIRELFMVTRLVPIYPIKTIIPVAAGFVVLQGIAHFLHGWQRLRGGNDEY